MTETLDTSILELEKNSWQSDCTALAEVLQQLNQPCPRLGIEEQPPTVSKAG